jgi:HK97 gp10 family phage protein
MFELRMSTHLNLDAVKTRVKKSLMPRLKKCGAIVEAAMKKKLSKGGKKRAPTQLGDKKATFITDPSKPGDPPHLQTGNLRSSIQYAETPEGTVVVGPSSSAGYGQVHEFGGKNHPKRPFARPALAESAEKFPEQFGNLDLGGPVSGVEK